MSASARTPRTSTSPCRADTASTPRRTALVSHACSRRRPRSYLGACRGGTGCTSRSCPSASRAGIASLRRDHPCTIDALAPVVECGATREASSFSSVNKDRFVSAEKIRRAASSFSPDRSRKLPSVCRRPPKWRFKIRVIKDWSTVRVERKPFRGVFSERRAPGRHKRDARRNAPCSRPKVTRLRPSHARQRHA